MKPESPSEQAIQRQILDLLAVKARGIKARGGDLWFGKMQIGPKMIGAGRFAPNPMAGFPDIPCLYRMGGSFHGQFIGFEVKRPNQRPTQAQIEMHEALRAAGAIIQVVDSVDSVAAFFGEYDAEWRKDA